MADNITILDGTGSSKAIATTDAASVHFQKVYAMSPGTTATDLGKAEDQAHSTGDVGIFSLAVRTDTRATTAGTTGDYAGLVSDASGSLWVNPGAAAMASLADATANPTAALVGCCVEMFNGTTWDRVRGDTTNGLDVDVTRVIPGTSATHLGKAEDAAHSSGDTGVMALGVRSDTLAALAGTTGDYTPFQCDALGAVYANVYGAAAHDAPVSGAPVLYGGEARTTDGTAVSSGDAVRLIADTLGKLVVNPYTIPENMLSGKTAAMTGTSDTAIIAAQGASVRIYVTSIVVANSHATTGTEVVIKDATTELFRVNVAAGATVACHFPVPLRLTANQALNAANITTGSNTYASAVGYKAAN